MRPFWVLLLAAALGLAQQTGTRTVTGVVTNGVTGEPINRALVQCAGQGTSLSAFTGADGHFSIDGVAGHGQAFVTAEKPGFSTAQMSVGSGEARLSLMPNGKISGRVLDADGEPIENLQIQLLSSQVAQGWRNWLQQSSAVTEENGTYSFPSLPAGRYLLHTLTRRIPAATPNARPEVYAPSYYPGVRDLASAQVIQVTAGQEASVDLSLQAEAAFRVSGSIPATQVPLPPFSLTDADGQPATFDVTGAFQGKFTIQNVPNGTWTLMLADGNSVSARADFEVSGSDIDGLQMPLQPAVSIPVTLTGAPGNSAQVHLVPDKGTPRQTYFSQMRMPAPPPGTDPVFFIDHVPPGRYRLLVNTSDAYCLASAASGVTDLTRDELLLAPGTQPDPIVVNLTTNCATLNGAAANPSSGFVVAVPANPQTAAKFAPIVKSRPFTLPGLVPGTYSIYAFSDLKDLEYANPEALREYHGQQIDLQAGQQTTVTVEVNQRENH